MATHDIERLVKYSVAVPEAFVTAGRYGGEIDFNYPDTEDAPFLAAWDKPCRRWKKARGNFKS